MLQNQRNHGERGGGQQGGIGGPVGGEIFSFEGRTGLPSGPSEANYAEREQANPHAEIIAMGYEIEGTIKVIMDVMTFGSGFTKREFVITSGDDRYPQDIKMEFVKDKVALLERFRPGQRVKVGFEIRGNENNGKYYVSLSAWRIGPADGSDGGEAPMERPRESSGPPRGQSPPRNGGGAPNRGGFEPRSGPRPAGSRGGGGGRDFDDGGGNGGGRRGGKYEEDDVDF